MIIKKPSDILSSDITPKSVYLGRREFLQAAGITAAATLTGAFTGSRDVAAAGEKLVTKFRIVTTDDRDLPAQRHLDLQQLLRVRLGENRSRQELREVPDLAVVGHGRRALQQARNLYARRHPQAASARGARLPHALRRSLVDGHSLGWLPARRPAEAVRATGKAKYVEFTTVWRPKEMPGQAVRFPKPILPWPYVEGLRMDEAMHPLAIIAVGMYGRNAAQPERRAAAAGRALEVRIQGHQVDREDPVRRQAALDDVGRRLPGYYGFYSNVNPTVDHPQLDVRHGAAHRRPAPCAPTLMFNGYGDAVASMYDGMDLKKNF